jgi:hypothetical protein
MSGRQDLATGVYRARHGLEARAAVAIATGASLGENLVAFRRLRFANWTVPGSMKANATRTRSYERESIEHSAEASQTPAGVRGARVGRAGKAPPVP